MHIRAMTISKARFFFSLSIHWCDDEVNQLYSNSVLASLNSRRTLKLKIRSHGTLSEALESGTPAGPIVHATRHIEFSEGVRSREDINSDTHDKVIEIARHIILRLTSSLDQVFPGRAANAQSDFVMMDFSDDSSHV